MFCGRSCRARYLVTSQVEGAGSVRRDREARHTALGRRNELPATAHLPHNVCMRRRPWTGRSEDCGRIFKSLRVGRVNLTSRGDAAALVVQGDGVCMCGAVGNCPFWLLSGGPNPKLLLKAVGIQSFVIQKSGANTRFDVVLGSHDSAMETDLQRFRFDGVRYQRTGCATIEWDDEGGNRLNPPRIVGGPCR